MLRLSLFGAPRLERDGRSVALRRSKATALLAYLAVSGRPQERESLLTLLWPEFDAASARNNLRRELSLLRDILGDDALQTEGSKIALHPQSELWLDVAQFQQRLAAAEALPSAGAAWAATLDEAVALAVDEFLAGFGLAESAPFEEWLLFQRDTLRRQLADALAALITWHRERGDHVAAIELARRRLALDPLHEAAQRELIRLFALAGEHAAALRQYESYRQLLATELGIEPDEEAQALATLVRDRQLGPPPAPPEPAAASINDSAPASVPTATVMPVPPELPPLSASFVGRAREVAEIVRRLTDPDCRLLTLIGPGGIGKTQLALKVAHTLRDALGDDPMLADGVAFVALLPVATSDGIAPAIASALQLAPVLGLSLQAQLLDHLRSRHMLLALDNFEHLLDGIPLIATLLNSAPGVRLLITSRVALNLQAEWFHPVEGLAVPPEGVTALAQLAHYDAVRLFEQLARRARADLTLSTVLQPIVRLCRLVAGMPLALELAAGWLRVLTVDQVVAALERDPTLLATRDRTVPDRHRSMQTVFDETWQLLSDAEQRTLVGLSVFVGPFDPAVAETVAEARLDVLADLVERALLRTLPDGRFQLHELLRQFAARKLPEVAEAAQERHGTHYLVLLADAEAQLLQRDGLQLLDALGCELGNLLSAWHWGLTRRRLDLIDRALLSIAIGFLAWNRCEEAETLFLSTVGVAEPGASASELNRRVTARALASVGAMRAQMGDHHGAVTQFERGLALADGLDLGLERAYVHLMLGRIAGWEGDEQTARRQIGAAMQIAGALGNQQFIIQTLPDLAWVCCSFGDFAEARQLAQEGVERGHNTAHETLDPRAQRTLGWAEACLGNYAAAERAYAASLVPMERFSPRHSVAAGLNGLGWAIWCAGDRLAEARVHLQRSLALLRELGNSLWVSNALGDLALAELDGGDLATARALSEEGLRLATRAGNRMYRVYHLGILGHLATLAGDFAVARAQLSEALAEALATRYWPRAAFVLYQIALLRFAEAEHGADVAALADGVELMAAVAHHRATWHVYRVRAERLLDERCRQLPQHVADEAVNQGRLLDWTTELERLVGQLGSVATAS